MVDMIKGLAECGIPESICAPLAEKMEAYIKEIILFSVSIHEIIHTAYQFGKLDFDRGIFPLIISGYVIGFGRETSAF